MTCMRRPLTGFLKKALGILEKAIHWLFVGRDNTAKTQFENKSSRRLKINNKIDNSVSNYKTESLDA